MDNVTFLGDVADDYDSQQTQAQQILDRWVENTHYNVGAMLVASTTTAFMVFGQSFVDLLRFGNGVKDGGLRGYGKDALRLISIGGIGGAAITRLSRILAVNQAAGTMTCSWVTAVNAMKMTGQRFFVTLDELAKAAGVSLPAISATGSGANELRALIAAFKQMGIPVRNVLPASSDIESLVPLVRNNSGSVVGFAINYVSKTGEIVGHQLFAVCKGTSVMIMDTAGEVYNGVAALKKVYSATTLATRYRDAFYAIENAAIIDVATVARQTGGLAQIVLELVHLRVIAPEKAVPTRVQMPRI